MKSLQNMNEAVKIYFILFLILSLLVFIKSHSQVYFFYCYFIYKFKKNILKFLNINIYELNDCL